MSILKFLSLGTPDCIDKAAVDIQRPAICGFDQCSNCGVECAKIRLVTTEKFVFG